MTIAQLLILIATWSMNKALPAMFHRGDVHQATPAQVQAADELCKLGYCEAKTIQALQGMRKVILLPIPADSPKLPDVIPIPNGKPVPVTPIPLGVPGDVVPL